MIKLSKEELRRVREIWNNLNEFEISLFQEAQICAGIKYRL